MLALVAVIASVALFQMFFKLTNSFPQHYAGVCIAIAAFIVGVWIVLCFAQQWASQTVFFSVTTLSLIGLVEIIRIDYENQGLGRSSGAGFNQAVWLTLALVLTGIALIAVRDYRVFRKFSYIFMIIGLILLFSPMIPGLGVTINGSRIWINIAGRSLQPAEFAKIFMAIFFASYLFDHRDQLAVGGKKIGKMHLPRLRDLGPIIVVWAACMAVLVLQKDLGTGLLFFAMFVCMLYVATGRTSWILIGLLFFIAAAVLAASTFPHVQNRVHAWMHPFDNQTYQAIGGSQQLVTGIFGLAAGGILGTGLGQGYPALTPLANSDFIFSSLGEELGLAGIFAILTIYAIIVGSAIVTAIKVKDGFGKLLASGLAFTMAFQVFTVIGGITLVIPLTGLTLPYMAAGGSSLLANWAVATLLLIISNQANKPEADIDSDTFAMAAMEVINEKKAQEERHEKHAHREPRAITSDAIPVVSNDVTTVIPALTSESEILEDENPESDNHESSESSSESSLGSSSGDALPGNIHDNQVKPAQESTVEDTQETPHVRLEEGEDDE
ncbi:FtsW/RodA/SpoVE family cell cycle protein [Alloscardovia venturai]